MLNIVWKELKSEDTKINVEYLIVILLTHTCCMY